LHGGGGSGDWYYDDGFCIIFPLTMKEEVQDIMEVIFLHRPIGVLTPEMMKAGVDAGKQILEKPTEFVPGGKIIAVYYARAQWLIVCIWEVPDMEAIMPFLEQMRIFGWNTEVIPAEKGEVAIDKIAKALGM